MAEYIYGCKNKEHPRVMMVHGMTEIIDIKCETCGKKMHKIPQKFRWYMNPAGIVLDKMDDKYREWRGKQKST